MMGGGTYKLITEAPLSQAQGLSITSSDSYLFDCPSADGGLMGRVLANPDPKKRQDEAAKTIHYYHPLSMI